MKKESTAVFDKMYEDAVESARDSARLNSAKITKNDKKIMKKKIRKQAEAAKVYILFQPCLPSWLVFPFIIILYLCLFFVNFFCSWPRTSTQLFLKALEMPLTRFVC